eukprot:5192411-Pleurochrysis_carterae.AAC.2
MTGPCSKLSIIAPASLPHNDARNLFGRRYTSESGLSGTLPTQLGQLVLLEGWRSLCRARAAGYGPFLHRIFAVKAWSPTRNVDKELLTLVRKSKQRAFGLRYASDNSLSGTLPTETGLLTNLTTLYARRTSSARFLYHRHFLLSRSPQIINTDSFHAVMHLLRERLKLSNPSKPFKSGACSTHQLPLCSYCSEIALFLCSRHHNGICTFNRSEK